MAGVQIKGGKCHGGGESKAMMRHACADERIKHKHSNEDINLEQTKNNFDIYGLTYQQMCDEYDKKMEYFKDQGKTRWTKQTVTMMDAIITAPKDLSAEREREWFKDVADLIDDHYGRRVVLDAKIHCDEVHDYTDPDTGKTKTSRHHGHFFLFPEAEDGKLCGKDFSSVKNLKELNREIDELSVQKYQCQFMTGEKTVGRSFQTVEQLKRASDVKHAEVTIERGKKLAPKLRKAIDRTNELNAEAEQKQEDITALEERERTLSESVQTLQTDKSTLDSQKRDTEASVTSLNEQMTRQQEELNRLNEQVADSRKKLKEYIQKEKQANKNMTFVQRIQKIIKRKFSKWKEPAFNKGFYLVPKDEAEDLAFYKEAEETFATREQELDSRSADLDERERQVRGREIWMDNNERAMGSKTRIKTLEEHFPEQMAEMERQVFGEKLTAPKKQKSKTREQEEIR